MDSSEILQSIVDFFETVCKGIKDVAESILPH